MPYLPGGPCSGFVPLPSDFLCSFNDSMATEAVLTVTLESVFEKLSKLNLNKVHGPDGIPSWLLKANTDLLAGPVTNMLNCSYREGGLPQENVEGSGYSGDSEINLQSFAPHFPYSSSIEIGGRFCGAWIFT